ncbi:MAG: sugar phosphate isomerase/epimerase family protein [Anaerolineae bacterium]|jgi:sugar phosphate isomerase/epimerase|nr:sugar phosphate isomerase/epimerase [Chloroflexota bacterium]
MQIFGRTQPLERYPILQSLEVIKRLGFDGVEVCLETAEMAPDRLTPTLLNEVRERLERVGLCSFSVGYHRDYIYDDRELERTLLAIDAAKTLGSSMLIFSGTAARTGDEAEWVRMRDRTAQLLERAIQHDIILAQEFEPGFIVGSTEHLLRLFEELPSPHLAANVDLGHLFLCDPDPIASIGLLGERIVHGHVENMATGVHNHLVPTEGDMDLGLYIQALERVGFAGGLALDLYNEDYEEVAPQQIGYLRSLMSAG